MDDKKQLEESILSITLDQSAIRARNKSWQEQYQKLEAQKQELINKVLEMNIAERRELLNSDSGDITVIPIIYAGDGSNRIQITYVSRAHRHILEASSQKLKEELKNTSSLVLYGYQTYQSVKSWLKYIYTGEMDFIISTNVTSGAEIFELCCIYGFNEYADYIKDQIKICINEENAVRFLVEAETSEGYSPYLNFVRDTARKILFEEENSFTIALIFVPQAIKLRLEIEGSITVKKDDKYNTTKIYDVVQSLKCDVLDSILSTLVANIDKKQ